MELHSTQESAPASTLSPAVNLVAEAERETARIRRSAEIWRRERMQPLQDALVSARTQEAMGANGCLLSGWLWVLGWLSTGFTGGFYKSLFDVLSAVCLVSALLLLPGSGGLYLFGRLRCRSVQGSAQEHRFELRDPGAAAPIWIVRGGSLDLRPQSSVGTQIGEADVASPAGARLEAGLAADRHYRAALADRFQRKFGWAAAVETFGRRGCLAAGVVAVTLLPCTILLGSDRLPTEDPVSVLLAVLPIVLAIGLPICTLLVGAGSGWRRWLLRAARLQALAVERVNDTRGPTP